MADGFKKGGSDSNVKSDGKFAKKGRLEAGSVKVGGGDAGAQATEKSHDVEFAKGGTTKMFGEQAAGTQKPAETSHEVSGGAPGAEFAKGGSNKMFGYSPSAAAQAGITSAR